MTRDPAAGQTTIKVPRSPARSHLDEPCPTCGVGIGEQCITRTNGDPAATHRDRKRLSAYLPVAKR